jgi:hypothetical protein
MADPGYLELIHLAYKGAVLSVPQEKRFIFDGLIQTDTFEGECKAYDDTPTASLREKTQRFATLTHTDATERRRWLYSKNYYDAFLFDKQDGVALYSDPVGRRMQNLMWAVERQKRDNVITAFDATVVGGNRPGDTSYTFTNTAISNATGRVVVHDTTNGGAAGGVSTGLTVEKLILIKEKFAELGVDSTSPINLVCSQRQISDLLREAELQSSDTSEVKALVSGQINQYMGIRFVQTNAITIGASNDVDSDTNVYKCYAWVSDGMLFAEHEQPTFEYDRRVDLVGKAWQLKVDFGCGAIRTHEDLVLKVECA